MKELQKELDRFIAPYVDKHKEALMEEKIMNRIKSENAEKAFSAFFPSVMNLIKEALHKDEFSISVPVPDALTNILVFNSLTDREIVLPNNKAITNPLYELIDMFYESFMYISFVYDQHMFNINWKFRDSKFAKFTPKDQRKFI